MTEEGVTFADAAMVVVDTAMSIVGIYDGNGVAVNSGFLSRELDTLCRKKRHFFSAEALDALAQDGIWQGRADHCGDTNSTARHVTAFALRNSGSVITHYLLFLDHTPTIPNRGDRPEPVTQTDPLTKLPGRTSLIAVLEERLSHAQRQKEFTALLFIAFDDLARFNDAFGFDVDDQLIVQLSKSVRSLLHADDLLARVGNYQFVVVTQKLHDAEDAEGLAGRILHMLSEPLTIGANMFYVSASIGISLAPVDADNAYKLLKSAENTVHRMQQEGKNQIAFTHNRVETSYDESVQLMADLPAAIENGEIYFVYQCQYSYARERSVGAEILARWRHPEYGEVSPELFIPLAEQSGMIEALTIKALIDAAKMFAAFEKEGIADFSLSVNISPKFLMSSHFIETTRFLLENYDLSGKALNFEVTEEILIRNMANLKQRLEVIREMGIRIEVDDYGTGYTSLNYLANLPIDRLKVDRSFVCDIDKERKRRALLKAIVDMSHAMDIDVVVEGVETRQEDEVIRTFEAMTVQGYYYCKTLSFDDLLGKLKQQ
jgi:diguanylate cyclase (GGDEF)-like protein